MTTGFFDLLHWVRGWYHDWEHIPLARALQLLRSSYSDDAFYPAGDPITGDAWVHDRTANSAIATLRAKLAAVEDQLRAERSGIESLLYEMQHPKQVLYEGPDVVVNDQGAYLTPWIDTNLWRWIGWWIANTGGNPLATHASWLSGDPAGAAPFITYAAGALALAAGARDYGQRRIITIGSDWDPSTSSQIAERYIRFYATSGAQATTCRCRVVGMR